MVFWDNATITVLSHHLHPTLLASFKHSRSPNHPRILHISIIERLNHRNKRERSAGCDSMEVNSNLNNNFCSTRNRGRLRNYLFVCHVSSVSFKHILVVLGRRLKGIASKASREVLEKGRLRVYKGEQNRTAQGKRGEEGRNGREGSGRKECCSI